MATINGSSGDDSLTGTTGGDQINAFDGADTATGGDGSDSLSGGTGNDSLSGDAGGDSIHGGAGNDTLSGGAGSDVFVVTEGSGSNTIEDCTTGDGDSILIDYAGIDSFAALQPYLSDDGNYGTLISLPDGSVTQVKWLNHATISESSFSFGSGPVCFSEAL